MASTPGLSVLVLFLDHLLELASDSDQGDPRVKRMAFPCIYIYAPINIYIVLYVLFMFAVSVFHGISWWQLVLFGFTFRIFRNLSDFSVFWIYLFNENRNAGVSGLSLFEALKLFKKSQGPNEEDLFLPSSWKSWRYWEEHTISIFINVCWMYV